MMKVISRWRTGNGTSQYGLNAAQAEAPVLHLILLFKQTSGNLYKVILVELLTQLLGRCRGKIGDDHVGAGPFDAEE